MVDKIKVTSSLIEWFMFSFFFPSSRGSSVMFWMRLLYKVVCLSHKSIIFACQYTKIKGSLLQWHQPYLETSKCSWNGGRPLHMMLLTRVNKLSRCWEFRQVTRLELGNNSIKDYIRYKYYQVLRLFWPAGRGNQCS